MMPTASRSALNAVKMPFGSGMYGRDTSVGHQKFTVRLLCPASASRSLAFCGS